MPHYCRVTRVPSSSQTLCKGVEWQPEVNLEVFCRPYKQQQLGAKGAKQIGSLRAWEPSPAYSRSPHYSMPSHCGGGSGTRVGSYSVCGCRTGKEAFWAFVLATEAGQGKPRGKCYPQKYRLLYKGDFSSAPQRKKIQPARSFDYM